MIRSITILLLIHLGCICGNRPLPCKTVRDPPHHIDLSYQSHLPSDVIAESIRDQIRRISAEHRSESASIIQTEVDNDHTADNLGSVHIPDSKMTTMAFEIDISSSLLRDEEIDNIMDAIASKDFEKESDGKDENSSITQRCVSINARMNPMTPIGAIALFNRLIVWGEMNADADVDTDTNMNETITQIYQDELLLLDTAKNITHEESRTIGDDDNDNVMDKAVKTSDLQGEQVKTENKIDSERLLTSFSPISQSEGVNIYFDSIDIGFNNLGLHEKDFDTEKEASTAYEQQRALMKTLEKVIENASGLACPRVLRMDHCSLGPSICRSIGRGIVDSAITSAKKLKQCYHSSAYFSHRRRLQALFLGGNAGIGDDGAAALAAALKIAPRLPTFIIPQNDENIINDNETKMSTLLPVLSTLTLSLCGIGDTGAEALAIAIAYNPGCIKSLDLSGNKISDVGAMAIGSALHTSILERKKEESLSSGRNNNANTEPFTCVDTIDLSDNKKIGDDGVSKLAAAMTCGAVRCLSLRSCSVGVNGASAVGKVLGKLASSYLLSTVCPPSSLIIEIDLSGNKLGFYETKKSGAKYSASALTSKASETTASYMNFIGKKIKNVSEFVGASAQTLENHIEDEEDFMNIEERSQKPSGSICGITSLCNAMIESIEGKNEVGHHQSNDLPEIKLGVRFCNLGDQGANALAAAIISLREKCGVRLLVDPSMNSGIGDDFLKALTEDNETSESILRDMARRHFDEMEQKVQKLTHDSHGRFTWQEGGYDFIDDSNDVSTFHSSIGESDGYDSYPYD